MTEFTDEQEAEIQKRIKEDRDMRERGIAFNQAFRLVVPYLRQQIDEVDTQTNTVTRLGLIDRFVLTVFVEECQEVLGKYFPHPEAPPAPEPANRDVGDA